MAGETQDYSLIAPYRYMPSGVVYVATPTGIAATDTANIQSALNLGKPVRLAAGTYVVNATLNNTIGNDLIGSGMNSTKIQAATGFNGTVYKAQQLAGLRIADLWIDCNNTAAVGIDTTWVVSGNAPSLNNIYQHVRISKYTSIGWEAQSNNDCNFFGILIEQSGTAISLDLQASGGQVNLTDCRIFGKTQLTCQSASIVGCVLMGIKILGTDYNVIQAHGGYWYADATSGFNIEFAAGVNAYPMEISGTHIENHVSGGAILGGAGGVRGQSNFIGTHIFITGTPATAPVLVQISMPSGSGPRPRINLIGGMLEGVLLTAPTNYNILTDNLSQSGVFNSRREITNGDGGTYQYQKLDEIGFGTTGTGDSTTIKHFIVSMNASTNYSLTPAPRSGLIVISSQNSSGPILVASYSKLNGVAGTVNIIQSTTGSPSGAFTLTVAAADDVDATHVKLTVSHTYTSGLIVTVDVLG